jgi:hypothetical protein
VEQQQLHPDLSKGLHLCANATTPSKTRQLLWGLPGGGRTRIGWPHSAIGRTQQLSAGGGASPPRQLAEATLLLLPLCKPSLCYCLYAAFKSHMCLPPCMVLWWQMHAVPRSTAPNSPEWMS